MRITDTYGRFGNPALDSTKKAAPAVPAKTDASEATGAPAAGGEKVTVSAQAQELADKAAASADSSKVNGLRAAIQNGTFKIDNQAIAKRIVDGG